jgi:hypothetical protein
MKTRKSYQTPFMEKIVLDHVISLALQSAPPEGPDEQAMLVPHFFNNDPTQIPA